MRKLIICYALCAAASAQAGIYRWVDSNGKTHYSDHAPSGGSGVTSVDVDTGSGRVDPEAERTREQLHAIEQGRQREQDYAAQQARQQQQRGRELAARCKVLQQKIEEEEHAGVIIRYDDAGNRVLWTDEERLAYRRKLHEQQRTYCAGASN